MKTHYIIGRSSSCDVRTPSGEDTVGKKHLEVRVLGGGRFEIRDLGTRNGTFLYQGSGATREWQPLAGTSQVDASDPIRLGSFATNLGQLMPEESRRPEIVSDEFSALVTQIVDAPDPASAGSAEQKHPDETIKSPEAAPATPPPLPVQPEIEPEPDFSIPLRRNDYGEIISD